MGVPFYDGIAPPSFRRARPFASLARVLRAEQTHLIDTFSHPNTVIFVVPCESSGTGGAGRGVISRGGDAGRHAAGGSVLNCRPAAPRGRPPGGGRELSGDYLVETEGLPREKMHVIHNGVDTRAVSPSHSGRARSRAHGARACRTTKSWSSWRSRSLKPLKRIDAC